MILILTHLIALFVGGFLGSALAFAVQAHLALRRELKAAQTALEAKETAPDDGSWKGLPPERIKQIVDAAVSTTSRKANEEDYKPTPDFTGGIGPTAIRNREIFEAEKKVEQTTPKFASPSVLNPDLKDIREAAREATNGGKPS